MVILMVMILEQLNIDISLLKDSMRQISKKSTQEHRGGQEFLINTGSWNRGYSGY